jgi:hypothetical protein
MWSTKENAPKSLRPRQVRRYETNASNIKISEISAGSELSAGSNVMSVRLGKGPPEDQPMVSKFVTSKAYRTAVTRSATCKYRSPQSSLLTDGRCLIWEEQPRPGRSNVKMILDFLLLRAARFGALLSLS